MQSIEARLKNKRPQFGTEEYEYEQEEQERAQDPTLEPLQVSAADTALKFPPES